MSGAPPLDKTRPISLNPFRNNVPTVAPVSGESANPFDMFSSQKIQGSRPNITAPAPSPSILNSITKTIGSVIAAPETLVQTQKVLSYMKKPLQLGNQVKVVYGDFLIIH
jgi:hypothetical protein